MTPTAPDMMSPALIVSSIAILVTMMLALVRAMLGPTVFDRVLALNMMGTKTVLLICVVGFLTGRTDFLDLALLYSLMNFIGMVTLLRFSQVGHFGKLSETMESLDQGVFATDDGSNKGGDSS
jgi:multicomponent Na+:H+ antiporter subunit F